MAKFNSFNLGSEAFVYIAYASDDTGTGFTLTFNASLNYIAILSTNIEIPTPVVGDFAGLWKNYKGANGSNGTNGTNGPAPFAVTVDGQGVVLVSGAVSEWVYIPYNFTITGWVILGDVTGSIEFDIWVDTLANFPPTVADSIVGDVPPTVTTARFNSGSDLTNWDTSLAAGSVLMVNIESVSAFTKAKIILTGVLA